jgi:hypothetical protein
VRLAIANFFKRTGTLFDRSFRKDRFGAPPLQPMRSNGQAFKQAREPRALPDTGRYTPKIDKSA